MKKKIIVWIAKTICKRIWEEYNEQIKLKNTQIKNLKQKNELLQMEVDAHNRSEMTKWFNN